LFLGICQNALAGKDQDSLAPNVVLILVDDLGYGDVCTYGCRDSKTPHIDSLAREGVKFTQAYVSAPVCSPSRAGLMTGRYQHRFGHEYNAGGVARVIKRGLGTPESEVMLPARLERLGYRTGMVGKWHLGQLPGQLPTAKGFQEFFGFLHGSNLYFPTLVGEGIRYEKTATENYSFRRSEDNPIISGTEPVEEGEYLTDAFTRESLAFIKKGDDEKPFFLYLAYNAPHTPLQVSQKYYERFPHITNEKQRIFAAMVSAVDDGVGRLQAQLKSEEITRSTMVLFLSDNGCGTYTGACFNDPLLGGKVMPFEGGIRIPFLMSWKDVIDEGMVIDEPVSSLDILPTVLEAIEGQPVDLPGVDGESFMPLVTNGKSLGRTFYWKNGDNWAVLEHPWKLISLNDRYTFLFDLENDVREDVNLAKEKPDQVERLREKYKQWSFENPKPLWETKGKGKIHLEAILNRDNPIIPTNEDGPGLVEFSI